MSSGAYARPRECLSCRRCHPKSSAETVANYRALEGEYLRFATEDNILELFPQADMMISDTSSRASVALSSPNAVLIFTSAAY